MEEIVNIEDIKVNTALPKEARTRQFVEELRNPYRLLVDEVSVIVVLTESSGTRRARGLQYFQLVMV